MAGRQCGYRRHRSRRNALARDQRAGAPVTDRQYPVRDLEQSILGAILIRPENLALLPSLESPDFRSPMARLCWEAIRNLESRNLAIDPVTVADEASQSRAHQSDFKQDRESKHSEVVAYLGECALKVPTADNAIEYARRLRDNTLRLRLLETALEIQAHAKNEDMTGADILSMALGGLSVLDAEQPERVRSIGEIVRTRIQQLEDVARERALGTQTLSGYPTGIDKLDEKLGGWQPGIVSLIAARPGMGKSSLGLATADAATAKGFGVHVFSLEDTDQAYADRTMARTSQVSAEQIRNCDLSQQDLMAIQGQLPQITKRKHWLFDDRSGITAQEIVRSVRRHLKRNNTKLVVVDYVQLVARPHPRMTSHEALSEIITTFADAAKHDRVAYVVMSQLNREIEKREDKRPLLADLRESGSLEERAKCVVAVYRGAAYGQPPKKGIDYPKDQSPPTQYDFERTVQLIVLKNSNGRTGTIRAMWHGPTTRME